MAYLRGHGETPDEAATRAHDSIATQFKVFGVTVAVLVAATVGAIIWSEIDERKHRRGGRR